MRICIIGGIFGKTQEYRAKHALTPETILVDGLRACGHDVLAVSHQGFTCGDGFDVVHAHHLARGSVIAASQSGPPFVFTGHSGPALVGKEISAARKMAFQYVVRKSQGLVALSLTEQTFLRKLASPRTLVDIIPNGIPETLFFPDETSVSRSDGRISILFVGQLIRLKGLDRLFHALKRISPRNRLKLLLVYQVDDLETQYRRLVADLDLTDQVEFLGFLPSSQLADLYRSVDFLVLPSLAESLPSVVTEALLSGIPVLASRVGGIEDQVGQYGVIVPPGDIDALAEGLTTITERLPYFRSIKKEIHRYAAGRFGVDRMIEAHLRFYEKVRRLDLRHRSTIIDKAIEGIATRL